MVPGVLVMTTYKLLLIPHRARKGSPAQAGETGSDERYLPFGHLHKEYLQVRQTCTKGQVPKCCRPSPI